MQATHAMTGDTDATRQRAAGHARRDRGAVAVEAALVFPLFVLLIFGVVEWSLVIRDQVSVTSAVRTGIRTATTLPRQAGMTQATADSIEVAGSAMPKDYINYILVYEPNSAGFPLPDGNTTYECQTGFNDRCDKFTWNQVSDSFNPTVGQQWNPNLINACPTRPGNPPSNITQLAVYTKATHPMVTGFFGGPKVIQDRAIARFEPMRPTECN